MTAISNLGPAHLQLTPRLLGAPSDVDEPRNTDNAWLETTAYHFHCSRELGALLPLKQAPANLSAAQKKQLEDYNSQGEGSDEVWKSRVKTDLGLNDIFWLDMEAAAHEDNDIYASHLDWIIVVRQRLEQMQEHPGLLQLVAQWGRVDVLEDVLKDQNLLAQRQPMQVQMAFQGALEHAIEPNFDLGLIELLMERGAKAADVYLPALFDLKGRDYFGLFNDIQHRRVRRWRSRINMTVLGFRHSGSGDNTTPISPERSSNRHKMSLPSTQESGEASGAPGAKTGPGLRRTLTRAGLLPESGAVDSRPVLRQSRVSRLKALMGDDDQLLARSPWRGAHIHFMKKFVKGFEDYGHEQHALHNVDLMFWALTAGALELAQLFWRRCRSPLRAALIAQDILTRIRDQGKKVPGLEESVALFSRHAVGVLEHLPDQETARRLLLSKVGDFATLGSPGAHKDSIMGLAINLQNKDFVSQRYCQEILDEMWWGRSPRSGRVCLQKPWPTGLSVYAQVLLPFFRILPVVPNDLCVGYPWMTDDELSESGGKKKVNVKWWKAMLAIWYIPRMKRAVVSISTVLFTLLFISVFLDRLCGPLTAERGVCFLLLVVWTFANVVQEVLQYRADSRAWKKSNDNHLEICTFFLLFAAFGLRWSLTSPKGHTAENLMDFVNYQSGGRIQPQLHSSARAREENNRYIWINANADDTGFEGECPWSIELECLRIVLGATAPLLILRFTDFLTLIPSIGVLMVCTKRMLSMDLMPWLTFVLVAVMFGSSLSLSILAPAYQLEAGNGPLKPFGGLSWGPTELDLSPGGPFWVSFYGLFGFYEPGEISTSTGASVVTPFVLMFYMMLVAVVFVNLLIAMFNQTYTETYESADEEWKMKRVDKVYSFMRLYPVPAPLNLIALMFDLIAYIVRDLLCCCCKAKAIAPKEKHVLPKEKHVLVRSSPGETRSSFASAPSSPSLITAASDDRRTSFASTAAGSRASFAEAEGGDSKGSALKDKGAHTGPTSRLQKELARQSTRVRLMSTDDSLQGSVALYSQDEAERAEDTARHRWLQWLENNHIASTAMGKKEDQILATVKRIFRDGGEVHKRVEMLYAKVEKLELKSMEHRQKDDDLVQYVHKKLDKFAPGQVRAGYAAPVELQPARPAPGCGGAQTVSAPLQPMGARARALAAPHSQLKKVVNVKPLPPLPRPVLLRPVAVPPPS